jgi:exonuclease SbcC
LEAVTPAALATLLDGFLTGVQTAKDSLDKATKEAKAKLDALKKKFDQAKLVASLESQRPHLTKGEPCPLCGALDHPYAGGAPDHQLQSLEREVENAEEAWEKAGDASKAATNTINSLITSRKAIDSDHESLVESRTGLAAALQPFGVVVPAPKQEDQLSSDLQAREKAYRTHLKARDEAVRTEKDANKTVTDAEKEITALTGQIEKLPPARDGAAPAKKPVPVAVDEAQSTFIGASDKESTKAALLKQRKDDAEEAGKKHEALRVILEKKVACSELKALDALRAALLDNSVAAALEQLDKQLHTNATEATALLDAARKEIKRLRDLKTLEGEDADKFKQQQKELGEQKEKLITDQTTRTIKIKTDDDNRRKKAEQEKATSDARALLAVWQRLRDLIGSSDGSKFRKYAQSITLDILLRHANRHLSKLSDRYRICRREASTLDLEIEDFYQAQTKRPMTSLSGGETFLVSLALALGLSDLAGRNVRIQSLFIDEGFGSLDPEALEIAIAALEGLRQEEKTIGVISHVEVLKERIGTQVVVEKQAGGISTLRVVAA